MPTLLVNRQSVSVPEGSTVLDACRRAGCEVPVLCHLDGYEHVTSCMVCVVLDSIAGRLVPACSAPAVDGMEIETENDRIRHARRMAVELLLSDHAGDCEAPCRLACPAHMNIPRMMREIAGDDLATAAATVLDAIALPAVLGRICPAPCERVCRRAQADAPVAICLLKRFVADLASHVVDRVAPPPPSDDAPRVAIVGAGPAGLAAAWHLARAGIACRLFDAAAEPGGALCRDVPADRLPPAVLDADARRIVQSCLDVRFGAALGADVSLDELRRDCAAVLLATGPVDAAHPPWPSLPLSDRGVALLPESHQTPLPGVFACGALVRPMRMAVQAEASGKKAAAEIAAFVSPRPLPVRPFCSRLGKLHDGEIEEFLKGADRSARHDPVAGLSVGFRPDEARAEAARCLECDCRKATNCLLRELATATGARQRHYRGARPRFRLVLEHPLVTWEPGKCIRCGRCIRIADKAGEPVGLTFIGRGFDVRVGVPFDGPLSEALRKTALECVAACPTAALALRSGSHSGLF